VVGGLDLSETRDLTALVLICNDVRDATCHVQPTFWLPSEGLYDKARVDRIPYDVWRDQGYLQTTPGPSVSYEYVAQRGRYSTNIMSRRSASTAGISSILSHGFLMPAFPSR
jgi:phage terminase large subunit-like protein